MINRDTSSGAPAARRLGLAAAVGAVVHFHDSDDLVGRGWLAATASAFAGDPDLDVLVTSREVQDRDDGLPRFVHPYMPWRLKDNIPLLAHYQKFENAIGPLGGVTFSRRIVAEQDLCDAPASQDWLMYDGVLLRAKKLDVRKDIHFIYRNHGSDRISAQPWRRVRGFVVASRKRFGAPRAQRLALLLYCAVSARSVQRVVEVEHAAWLRILCRSLARFPRLARLAGLV